jgi:hypothetical protein
MNKSVFSRRGVRLAVAALLCTPLVLLTACGGGGGGGDEPPATGIVITNANSQTIAAEAVETASSTDAAAGAGFVLGVQVNDGAKGANTLLLARAARQLVAKAPASGALATGVTAETEVQCTTSGSVTMKATTSGSSGSLSAGDSFQITANACAEGSGADAMLMNGSITVTVQSGSYDPASTVYPKNLTMRIVAQGFSVTVGGETEAFTGDVTIGITETSATSGSLSITATSLTSNLGGAHSVTLKNYTLNATETSGGTTIAMSAGVVTTNSSLGSGAFSYTIATVTPLTVSSTGAITGGSIKVTGSGSSLLLTVTGSDSFTLDVDANGDDVYESRTTVTRTELQGQV